jgi:ADP-ribose pyrophosphatase
VPIEGDDAHLIERGLGSELRYAGSFLTIQRDRVQLPDGSEATREYVAHPGAVAVVPLLDDGRAVLVRQYRFPVAKVLLEWPAGKRDPGESTLATAMRELEEETGYRAREWAYGGEIHNAAAYSTESIWIWFARGLERGPQRLDRGEFVEVVVHSADELEALDRGGTLPDVKTLIGLKWWNSWRRGERALAFASAEEAARLG